MMKDDGTELAERDFKITNGDFETSTRTYTLGFDRRCIVVNWEYRPHC